MAMTTGQLFFFASASAPAMTFLACSREMGMPYGDGAWAPAEVAASSAAVASSEGSSLASLVGVAFGSGGLGKAAGLPGGARIRRITAGNSRRFPVSMRWTLTGAGGRRYGGAMSSAIGAYATTRPLRRMEYDRLVALGMFAGERLELLDGALVVREPQGSAHAAIAARAGEVLAAAFGAGWHCRLHAPLAVDDASEPEPDVAVVLGNALDYVGAHPSSAALVVEVADSSLRLDRRLKAGLYARARLPEYWIVNLVDGVLEVHRDPQPVSDALHGWAYRSVEILSAPTAVTPVGAPGRPIPVAELLP